MANAIATLTEEKTITFALYANANGKDYHEISFDGIPSQKFVEVPEASTADVVRAAFDAGNIF